MSRTQRTFTIWMAALAVWFGALAPAVSMWLASTATASGERVEVCSTQGTRWVDVQSSKQNKQPSPASEHGQKHCPFCVTQHGMDLPPKLQTQLAALALGHAMPALFLQAPRTLHAWSALQARAPPQQA